MDSLQSKLEPRYLQVPLPARRVRQSELSKLLDGLPNGQAVDIPREIGAVYSLIYRYRQRRGAAHHFLVRRLRPGVSRVWRKSGAT